MKNWKLVSTPLHRPQPPPPPRQSQVVLFTCVKGTKHHCLITASTGIYWKNYSKYQEHFNSQKSQRLINNLLKISLLDKNKFQVLHRFTFPTVIRIYYVEISYQTVINTEGKITCSNITYFLKEIKKKFPKCS